MIVAHLPRLSVLTGEKIENILQVIVPPIGIQIVQYTLSGLKLSAVPGGRRHGHFPEMWQY